MATKYQYSALSKGHSIRLLSVASDEDKPHGISLSLSEVDLDDKPEFCALSYTWHLPEYENDKPKEDPGPGLSFDVECDGKMMAISENLFRFLAGAIKVLRTASILTEAQSGSGSLSSGKCSAKSTPQTKSPKYVQALSKWPIWIDAFCINQADADERGHQVLLMDKIYSSANNVLVWLGENEPSEGVVWIHDKFIPILARLMQKNANFVTSHLANDPLCESGPVVSRIGPDMCSRWAASWMTFANFLDRRRWFDRGWIVQEVALCDPSNVLLLCGTKELVWKRLAAFSRFLQQTGWATSLRARVALNATRLAGSLSDNWMPGYELPMTFPVAGTLERHLHQSMGFKTPVGSPVHTIDEVHHMIADLDTQSLRSPRDEALDNSSPDSTWLSHASHLIAVLRTSNFGDDRDHIHGCLGLLRRLLPPTAACPILPDYEKTVEAVFTSVAALFLDMDPPLSEVSQVEDRKYRRYHSLPSWVPDYSVPHRGNLQLNTQISFGSGSSSPRRPILSGSTLIVNAVRVDILGYGTPLGGDPSWRAEGDEVLLDILSLVHRAHTIHSSTMALDFWNTLSRGNLGHYLRDCAREIADLEARRERLPLKEIVREFLPPDEPGLSEEYGLVRMSSIVTKSNLLLEKRRIMNLTDQQVQEMRTRRFKKMGLDLAMLADLETRKSDTYWPASILNVLYEASKGLTGQMAYEAKELLSQLLQISMMRPRLNSQPIDKDIWEILCTACLYATEMGRIGIGPASISPEDEIWLLEGARAPFVLRKANSNLSRWADRENGIRECYSLVGETYLQGLMDEKFMEEMKRENGFQPIAIV